MLHGYVFVTHGFCLVLSINQSLIQIFADILLAAGNLYPGVQCLVQTVCKMFGIDLHFFNQLQDQRIFLMNKIVEQMLLLDLLIAEIIGCFFQFLHGLQGFLCKFTYIHMIASFLQANLCYLRLFYNQYNTEKRKSKHYF